MRHIVQFTIHNNEGKFFGPGIAALLMLVEEKGSLRTAAKEMGMAYSKAWKIVKKASTQLGFEVLDSHAGGKHGGGAMLTDKGKAFLSHYIKMDNELQTHADTLFKKYFAK